MELTKAVFKDAAAKQQEVELPCNMAFNYTETETGIIVLLSGFTAGPPATVNSPQILVPGYNPAACFNGPSIGGKYYAYMIAFLDTQKTPTIKLRGWVTSVEKPGTFSEVSMEIPVQAKLINQ